MCYIKERSRYLNPHSLIYGAAKVIEMAGGGEGDEEEDEGGNHDDLFINQ